MRGAHTLVATALLALANCTGMRGGEGQTQVFRAMLDVSAVGPDAILTEAVFALVQGQSRAEAIATLENDGATCAADTCVRVFTWRENWFDTIGIRMPGPYRTYRKTWHVVVLADPVMSAEDIEARVDIQSRPIVK